MRTILSQPGQMVDVLAKGHCHQGKLTHFSHKILLFLGLLNDHSIFAKIYCLPGTRQSNVSKVFI